MTLPIVDVHTHVVPRRLSEIAQRGGVRHGIEFARDEVGRITSSIGGPAMSMAWPTPLESTEDRVAAMDALGVDKHLVSLTPTMHWYGLGREDGVSLAEEVNDDIAEMVADHPDRFHGMGFLPLQDPKSAVAELERCMSELGFVGALVGTHVNGLDWDADELFEVLVAARDLGAFVFVHPARGRANSFLREYHLRNLLGNPLETAIALSRMIFGGVLDALPDLEVCFAHGGGYGCIGSARLDHGADVRAEADALTRLPSEYLREIYVDSLVHGHRTLDHVIDVVGIDRVLLGSDYPADMGEPNPVEFIRSHQTMNATDQEMILSTNAARILS